MNLNGSVVHCIAAEKKKVSNIKQLYGSEGSRYQISSSFTAAKDHSL